MEHYSEDVSYTDHFINSARQAAKVEMQLGKDLIFFNRKEVSQLLKIYKTRDRNYLRSIVCRGFSDYYNWCYDEGFVDKSNFDNWYDVKLSKKIIEEVLTMNMLAEKYFNEDTFLGYVEMVKDPQEKLLLAATYLGIDGEDHEELKNMKLSDLDEQNKIMYLCTGRKVKVNDLFIEQMKSVEISRKYSPDGIQNNGTFLKESKYSLKVSVDNDNENRITSQRISRYFENIRKLCNNPTLKSNTVKSNGAINYLIKYFANKNLDFKMAYYEKQEGYKSRYKYNEEIAIALKEFGYKADIGVFRNEFNKVINELDIFN